jgi:hypothetical protein
VQLLDTGGPAQAREHWQRWRDSGRVAGLGRMTGKRFRMLEQVRLDRTVIFVTSGEGEVRLADGTPHRLGPGKGAFWLAGEIGGFSATADGTEILILEGDALEPDAFVSIGDAPSP